MNTKLTLKCLRAVLIGLLLSVLGFPIYNGNTHIFSWQNWFAFIIFQFIFLLHDDINDIK
jgi:hypothetical protein